jgi:regulator of nucleoside diphosphate kinase
MRGKSFPGKAELEAELDRADVVEPQEIPPTVVTMNSTVKFRVHSSQEEFQLTLVYPKDVDQSGGTISVLAPVGSALLGLSQGDEIEWPMPGGGTPGPDRGNPVPAGARRRIPPLASRGTVQSNLSP